jgi:ribonuclease HI
MSRITIYTDGAARGNPGPGGYGIVLLCKNLRKELSEGFQCTTNNRMELLAASVALEALKKEDSEVVLYTDSKYVADAINKGWVYNWEQKHFKNKKNPDLWVRFLKAFRKHKVTIKWVKGHSNNKENNRCDELAVAASKRDKLREDTEYVLSRDNDMFSS